MRFDERDVAVVMFGLAGGLLWHLHWLLGAGDGSENHKEGEDEFCRREMK